MKASELVGEIRRAARLYEVFKKADEIATMLAESERMESDLMKQISKLKDEAMQVEQSIEEALARKEREVADRLAQVAKAEQAVQEAKELAASIMQRARQESSSLISAAKAEVAQIKQSIASLRQEESVAGQELMKTKNLYHDMLAEMQAKKDQFLKVFN